MAQSAGDFYLESIRPTMTHLESVNPRDGSLLPGDNFVPDPDSYRLDLGAGPVNFSRSFERKRADDVTGIGIPLGVSFRESMATNVGLNIGQTTSMSFTSTTQERKDLRDFTIDSTTTSIMGLQQTFGGGHSASAFTMTRKIVDQASLNKASTRFTTDSFSFKSGIAEGWDLSVSALQETGEGGALEHIRKDLAANFQFPLSGGAAPMGFSRSHQVVNGREIKNEKVDIVLPFAFNGGQLVAEHHSDFTNRHGVHTKKRTTQFTAPMRLFGQDGNLAHTVFAEDKGQGQVETRTSQLVSPFKIGDKVFGVENTMVSLRTATSEQDTMTSKLSAPLWGGQATLQRQTVTRPTETGDWVQRQMAFTLPAYRIADMVSLQGQRIHTDTPGNLTNKVTNLNITAQPLEPLRIQAQYLVNDSGPQKQVRTRKVHSTWAAGDRLSIQGQYSEIDNPGISPTTFRLVEIVRPRSGNGLGLTAGLASWGQHNKQIDDGRRVELVVGNPKGLAVRAGYAEYDIKKNTPYDDDAVVAIAVEHGTPERFLVRWRYEDAVGRVAPYRVIDLAMPVLGGSLALGFSDNPVGPDNVIRQAEQYDATLRRTIFSDVNMEVGYRYLDYDSDEVDKFMRIKLDGGQERRGGKIALVYHTGDFSYDPKKKQLSPESTLDLSYSRVWGPDTRINLTLSRQTSPVVRFDGDNIEARMEYKVVF